MSDSEENSVFNDTMSQSAYSAQPSTIFSDSMSEYSDISYQTQATKATEAFSVSTRKETKEEPETVEKNDSEEEREELDERQRIKKERLERMNQALSKMTDAQRNCYMHFFCSKLKDKSVKTIVLSVAKKMGIRYYSNDKDIKAIAGMAKVFVGELCNKAITIQKRQQKSKPNGNTVENQFILPSSLEVAYAAWQEEYDGIF